MNYYIFIIEILMF